MYNVLRLPERVENPVARHALGLLEEGRWSRTRGLLPAFHWALATAGVLLAARHALFPREPFGMRTMTSPIVFSTLFLLPLPACFLSGFWTAWRQLGRLKGDARFRDLAVATPRVELREGLESGLAAVAIVLPATLFQVAFLLLALDAQFQPGIDFNLSPPFLLAAMAVVFLVGAGPALDYGLALGLREKLAGAPAPSAFAKAAAHLAAVGASLVVGLGVFGLVFMNVRANAMKRDAEKRLLGWLPEDAE